MCQQDRHGAFGRAAEQTADAPPVRPPPRAAVETRLDRRALAHVLCQVAPAEDVPARRSPVVGWGEHLFAVGVEARPRRADDAHGQSARGGEVPVLVGQHARTLLDALEQPLARPRCGGRGRHSPAIAPTGAAAKPPRGHPVAREAAVVRAEEPVVVTSTDDDPCFWPGLADAAQKRVEVGERRLVLLSRRLAQPSGGAVDAAVVIAQFLVDLKAEVAREEDEVDVRRAEVRLEPLRQVEYVVARCLDVCVVVVVVEVGRAHYSQRRTRPRLQCHIHRARVRVAGALARTLVVGVFVRRVVGVAVVVTTEAPPGPTHQHRRREGVGMVWHGHVREDEAFWPHSDLLVATEDAIHSDEVAAPLHPLHDGGRGAEQLGSLPAMRDDHAPPDELLSLTAPAGDVWKLASARGSATCAVVRAVPQRPVRGRRNDSVTLRQRRAERRGASNPGVPRGNRRPAYHILLEACHLRHRLRAPV